MAKKESTEWKHDIARAERKARLSRMKDAEGHKRKIESRSIWKKLTLSIVAVALVLALAVWLIASTGVVTKSVTAMTVADRKLTAADINMVLGNMTASEQYGLAFTDEFQNILDQPSQYSEGGTVRDDLLNQIMPGITFMYAALSDMDKNQFEPTEAQLAKIEEGIKGLRDQFAEMAVTSGRGVRGLLKLYYGPGTSMSMVERDLRNAMMINFYEEEIKGQADLSDAQVEAFYQEHKDQLDVFSYNSYVFKLEKDDEWTEDEKEKALEDLKNTAELALSDLKENAFKDAVLLHLSEEDAKALEEDSDSLFTRKARAEKITTKIYDFVKEEDRTMGDAIVVEGTDSMTLVEFKGREKDSFKPYSVRHILIANSEDEDKSDKALKMQADQVLEEYMAGDQTEEAFVKLVVQYSKDPGSVQAGGLYSDVPSGKMVPEFENWCTEEGRKKGDTGIVKSTHGYHIMYFEGYGDEPELPGKIKGYLVEEYLNQWISDIAENAQVVRHPFGMKFAGKVNFFDALFGPAPKEPETTVPQLAP